MDTKDLKRDIRKINQKSRILKLIMLLNAYRHFTQAELNRSLIDHENTWKSAEKTADLVNFFFEERNAKPEDFMYRKTDLIDHAIDHWNEFKQWISPNIASGISDEALTAFCKRVDRTDECWMLKISSGMHYPIFLNALYLYMDGKIGKDALSDNLREVDIFSKEYKTKPTNIRLFRRCIVSMESIIEDIQDKQKKRRGIDVSCIPEIMGKLGQFEKTYRELNPSRGTWFKPSVKEIIISRLDVSENLCKIYHQEEKYTNEVLALAHDLELALSQLDFDYDIILQPFITGHAIYYQEEIKGGGIEMKNYILLECRVDFKQLTMFFDELKPFIYEVDIDLNISAIESEVMKIYRNIPANKLDERLPKLLGVMVDFFKKDEIADMTNQSNKNSLKINMLNIRKSDA